MYKVAIPSSFKVVSLISPADLNFGKVSRIKMSILNRLFIDAHLLFGLEQRLKDFDVAYVSETFYGFTQQCIWAKNKGYLKSVVSHASENTPFNNEGIWGRKAFKQRALKEVDKFVAITEGAKKVLLQEGCDPKKIVRLQPGVDLEVFKPVKVVKYRNLDKNKNVKLLFVGRLVPEKGILQIMEKFSNLYKKHPNIELIIADRGPLAPLVEEFAKSHKNVFYLGRIDDYSKMNQLYSLCDIYLHYSIGSSTWVEQYGFTPIEAMACGLPVLGLDKGSVKEVVREGGFVVDAKKYDSILEKLILDSGLRSRTGKKALKLVNKRYNALQHGKDLEKIFRATLSA